MDTPKKILFLSGILVILFIVTGGMIVWRGRLHRQALPSFIEETANWKIYQNNDYNFEMKYPQDWDYVMLGGASSLPMLFASGNKIETIQESYEYNTPVKDNTSFPFVMIAVFENKVAYEEHLSYETSTSETTSSSVNIGGIEAIYYLDVLEDYESKPEGREKKVRVVVEINDGYLVIMLLDYQQLDIFEKALSTFKFEKTQQALEPKTKNSSLVPISTLSQEAKEKVSVLCEQSSDPSYCNTMMEIISTSRSEDCESLNKPGECYYWLGISTKDPNLCKKIDQDHAMRDACYMAVAMGTNDAKLCEKVVLSGLCYRTMAQYKGDPELCKKCSETEFCYYNVAIKTRDIKLCEKGWWANRCRAAINQEPKMCEEDEFPGECYLVLALAMSSPELCTKTNNSSECYLALASAMRSSELCMRTNNPSECYGDIAIMTQDSRLCKMTENPEDCYLAIALAMATKCGWMFE